MTALASIPLESARRRWFAAQGLPRAAESAVAAVEQGGYVRTLGGVDVYLALRARVPGLTRAAVDAAVEAGELQVVPSVRGCIYLVARDDVPWSLRIADLLSHRRRTREYEKVGITDAELRTLGDDVLSVLADGPASTHDLRKALEGRIRSLGDAGKKVGISSTLPPALRELEFQGRLTRLLDGGRLDTERYLWHVTAGDVFADGFPDEEAPVHRHLAERFLAAAGLATVDRFASWAGLGKRAARAAVGELETDTVAVEGSDEPHLRLAGSASEESEGVAFLPFEDNLIQLRSGVAPLVDSAHHHLPVPTWGRGGDSTLGAANHMAYRSLVVDGEVVGVWEHDPDQGRVAWAVFGPLDPATERRIEAEAHEVATFLADDVGRAISFSIDTEDDLRRRAGRIREMAST